MDKEIHYEVINALEKLEQLYSHIDNAIQMSDANSFLHDTLVVASRNLGMTRMKLQVASDVTETIQWCMG